MIFGIYNIYYLLEILEEVYLFKVMVVEVWFKEGDVIENFLKVCEGNIKVWVNIMYGCDKFCIYCIVLFIRGKEWSCRFEDIIDEVCEFVCEGYKEIMFLG